VAGEEKVDVAIGGNISVGGNATGSVLVTGQHITAMVTGPDAADRRQVPEALIAIRAELGRLAGPKAQVASTLAATAAEPVNKEQLDEEKIGTFLESALRTASECAEYAGVTMKLLPCLQPVADGLGGQWISLTRVLSVR
jgi:hypothetical protein